jgi:Fe-S cluster biogenesis protein NfuA
VVDEKDFQQRIQKIGGLVHDLETIADPAVRAAAKELVQLLMDLHGTGLERILEIVFQSGESGSRIIDDLGQDQLVSSLLVLYGLHPDELQTRVERKLEQIVSKLHKMGAEAKLVSVIGGGDVRVRVRVDGHTCGSTSRTVQTAVEEAMYEAAPDMTSLVVEGLEQPADSGFIAIEKLLGSAPHDAAPLPGSATIHSIMTHSTITHPTMIRPTMSPGSESMD